MNVDDHAERVKSENAEQRDRLAELEKKAAQFDALCSLTEDVLLVLDADGNYLDAAPTRWFPPDVRREAIGMNLRDRFPRELAERLLASIQRALATGEPGMIEYPVHLLGRDVFHRALFKPLSASTVFWMAFDVTIEHDLRTAERQRIELQEQVIEAQRAAIRELSTPLMPLADGVVAMPLIGVIDSARAQEVMERLLDGIVKQRAHTAILDLTGVAVADSHVAGAMLQAARAAKLLGARLILTGISPAMARALVQVDAEMSGIVTLGDLQSGIRYALRSADRGRGDPR